MKDSTELSRHVSDIDVGNIVRSTKNEEPMKSQKEETPEFKHCPLCGMKDTLTKKKVTRQKIKGNQIVKAVFDMWECGECKEGFFQHWTMETKDIPKTDKA